MGFMSSLKRYTAAVATGGFSLTQSTKRQEQIGTAVGAGVALVAGGAAASSLFGASQAALPGADLPPEAVAAGDYSSYGMGFPESPATPGFFEQASAAVKTRALQAISGASAPPHGFP